MKVSHRIGQLARSGVLTLLLLMVLIVPLLLPSSPWVARGGKLVVFQLMALALVGLALISAVPCRAQRVVACLRTGPNLPVVLLVFYGAISWAHSTSPAFSEAEWLRLACNAGLFFVAGTMLSRRSHVRALVDGLLAVAALIVLFGFLLYIQTASNGVRATFGDRQLFAGFLLMLLPLLLLLAFSEDLLDTRRSLLAKITLVLTVAAMLLAQTRSTWLAAVVELVAVVGMVLRGDGATQATGRRGDRRQSFRPVAPSLGSPRLSPRIPPSALSTLAIVVGSLGLFMAITGSSPLVAARATTLTRVASDADLAWRFHMWKGAWQLIRERPLFGWGIGTFPLEQARTVPDSLPRDLLARTGSSLGELAHNEYLQTAAELGLVGLGLYLWVLGAFLACGFRALSEQPHGFRKLVLMGCLAAVIGQVVDAMANPAWRFADVSFMLWLLMGLGMAVVRQRASRGAVRASRGAERASRGAQCAVRSAQPDGAIRSAPRTAHRARERSEPRTAHASAASLAWQVAACGITLLAMTAAWTEPGTSPATQHAQMTLRLRVQGMPPRSTAKAPIPIHPGERIAFRLEAQITPASEFVDVTDSRGATFRVEPSSNGCPDGDFTLIPDAKQKGVFRASAAACRSTGCPNEDNPQIQIVARFNGHTDSKQRVALKLVCP